MRSLCIETMATAVSRGTWFILPQPHNPFEPGFCFGFGYTALAMMADGCHFTPSFWGKTAATDCRCTEVKQLPGKTGRSFEQDLI